MCQPKTFFRLAWCAVLKKIAFLKLRLDWHCATFVISRGENDMSFYLITSEVTLPFSLKKQANKSSLILQLVSCHKCLCFRTLHLTFSIDLTKFAQYQSETCLRN